MSTVVAPLAHRSRRARGALGSSLLLAPGSVLLVVFAAFPLLSLLLIGFTRDTGGITVDNFAGVLGSSTYVQLLGRTMVIAFGVTAVSIAIGWPAAWALARYTSPTRRPLILGLVVIPYITSQLLLIYGYVSLIQAGGPIMSLLVAAGLADPQASIMYSPLANFLVLVQESIPTAILVMYSASEQIDGRVLEASRTLGASKAFVFTRVIWPLCSSMVGVNFALTFVQTVGAFAEPSIVGGPNGQMFGNTIAAQIQSGVNEQFAVALTLVLLVVSLAVVGAVIAALSWSRTVVSGVDRPPRRRRPPRAEAATRPEHDAAETLK